MERRVLLLDLWPSDDDDDDSHRCVIDANLMQLISQLYPTELQLIFNGYSTGIQLIFDGYIGDEQLAIDILANNVIFQNLKVGRWLCMCCNCTV